MFHSNYHFANEKPEGGQVHYDYIKPYPEPARYRSSSPPYLLASSSVYFVFQVFIRVQDSNDNAPVFSQPAYDISVSEDVPVDMELLRVRASDIDERSRLSFSIYGSVDPASMRLFRVNPSSGVVYTTDRLDYEARTQHILTIMVRYRREMRVPALCSDL